MQDFYDCPYCAEELEQWSVRFARAAVADGIGEQADPARREHNGQAMPQDGQRGTEGLALLSLCPGERCGYYVLRYRNGLVHWDRDVEAARVLRTLVADDSA